MGGKHNCKQLYMPWCTIIHYYTVTEQLYGLVSFGLLAVPPGLRLPQAQLPIMLLEPKKQ